MGFTSAQARKALRETVSPPYISPIFKIVLLILKCSSGTLNELLSGFSTILIDDAGEESVPASGPAPATTPGSQDVPAKYKLGFISHKGPSVHSGHRVAHPRKGMEGEWILFNDEKVVKADAESVKELKKLAYLYFFARV